MQQIGKVMIDDTYYPGEDLYSDGPVEEELLEIARTYPEEEWNQVIADRSSWPVLYHFSHIRQNILEWIPFKKTDKVLEIGAGCGAITGAIAKKAGSVTCIDLSMMRSRINAYRNREYDNVEILVGNFRDIERNLEETYDYITLIGVFEYAEGYMGGSDPYYDMLACIEKHLAPGGKIVLAIENRLGLKYWSGATEDHFGKLFVGLEGYRSTSGVKTFSRKELLELLNRAGDFETSVYYPYPDYKLPMTIYSDDRLPAREEITGFAPNFDRSRIALFSEPDVWNSVIDAGLFPEFSNSFLLLAQKREGAVPGRKLLYTKYSNERSRRFAIRTDIWEENGQPVVEKTALYEEGLAHVLRLPEIGRRLNESYAAAGFQSNRCEVSDGTARLEYVTGETLEERLTRWIDGGKPETARQEMVEYLKKIGEILDDRDFVPTEAFQEVFGNEHLPEGLRSGQITNIDMVCQNLVLTGIPTVLDYEWTFEFPIPREYVQYRVIHYFTANRGSEFPMDAAKLYEEFGISKGLRESFARMESRFQRYLIQGHTPIRELHGEISPGVQKFTIEAREYVQVFFNLGEGYSEKDSVLYPIENSHVSCTVPLPEGCVDVRVDPGSKPCMACFKEISFDGQPADLKQALPKGELSGRWLSCPAEDPNLSCLPVPAGAKALTLKLGVFATDASALEKSTRVMAENRRLRQELGELSRHPVTARIKKQYKIRKERKQ